MTVIHIVEAFGGGVIEFIRYIIHFDRTNNHVIFYGKRDVDSLKVSEEFMRANVNLIEWVSAQRGISFSADYRAYKELSTFLNKFDKSDLVIHLHSSKAGVLGRVWGRLNSFQRIIYTPNGISYARKDISAFAKIFYQTIEGIASFLSGSVICVSESERDLYRAVDKSATYINNGIIIDSALSKVPMKTRSRFVVVTTGRLTEQKNPELFNSIASRFVGNDSVEFVWIGDGDLRDQIKASNIRVTGWIHKRQIFDELQNADLYISTALWEGLPFAVLEAMNCRLPLLLYNCVGNVDLVKEGVNGNLFSDQDQAYQIISQFVSQESAMVEDMGLESYNILCSDFNAEQMSASYVKAYHGMLNHIS